MVREMFARYLNTPLIPRPAVVVVPLAGPLQSIGNQRAVRWQYLKQRIYKKRKVNADRPQL
jgi:hypothetical protein